MDLNKLSDSLYTDPTTGQQYEVEPGAEALAISLLADAEARDLSLNFPRDSEFLLTGLAGTQTGAYELQLVLPDGKQLSSSRINNANMVGTAQFPVPIFPAVRVPAGGKIGVATIKDLSGAANDIQLVFFGLRLYRIGQPASASGVSGYNRRY